MDDDKTGTTDLQQSALAHKQATRLVGCHASSTLKINWMQIRYRKTFKPGYYVKLNAISLHKFAQMFTPNKAFSALIDYPFC